MFFIEDTSASLSPLSPILRLPNELLELIVQYLDRDDLKAVRLVSSRFSRIEATTARHFESRRLPLNPANIKTLERLTHHQHLSKHVSTLAFRCPWFESDTEHVAASEEEEAWEIPISATPRHSASSDPPERFQSMFQKYQQYLRNRNMIKRLAAIFTAFPKLKHIRICDIYGSYWDDELMRWPIDEDYLEERRCPHCSLFCQDDFISSYLSYIIRAIVDSGVEIRSLEFEWSGPGGYLSRLYGTDLDDLAYILEGVEALSFGLDVNGNELALGSSTVDEQLPAFIEVSMKDVMRWAYDLKHFEIINMASYHPLDPSIQDIFLDITWERLSSLKLDRVKIDEVSFWDFLQRHRSTLEDVSMSSVHLNNWKELLWEMRRNFKMLKRCSLYEIGVHVPWGTPSEKEHLITELLAKWVTGGPWDGELKSTLGEEKGSWMVLDIP